MDLDFVQNGSSLLDLTTGAYNIERFDPGVPELRDERVASVYHDGEEVLYTRYKNAMATANLLVLGATASAVNASVEAISAILSDIKALKGTGGEPIYIRFGAQGSPWWESEIIQCRMLQSDNRAQEYFDRASKAGTTDSFFQKITLIIERAPYWQDYGLTELALTNGNGTDVTGGLQVENSNDASNDNFVEIDGADVLGTERTPLKIRVKRDLAGTDKIRKVHISRNGRYTPNAAKVEYEIEDSTALFGSYSTVTDTKYSNGSAIKWSPLPTTYDFRMLYGTITGTNMQIYRGRWFHVLLTVDDPPVIGVARVRFVLLLGFDDEVVSTDWYDITEAGVHDIGAIKIPPSYLGDIQHMSLVYELHGYDPYAAGTKVTIDSILLVAAETEDGYMIGEAWGTYLGTLSGYIFDGDRKNTYGFLAPTPLYMDYITKTGKYIQVAPGEDCRLIFVWDTYTQGGAKIFASADETYEVQMWYRKRVLHI